MKINWRKPGSEIEIILQKEFNFVKSKKGWDLLISDIKVELPKEIAIAFIKYSVKNFKYFIFKYKETFPEKFKILYEMEIKEFNKSKSGENTVPATPQQFQQQFPNMIFPGFPKGWYPGLPLPANFQPAPYMRMPQGWKLGLPLPANWNPVDHIVSISGDFPGMPNGWTPDKPLPPEWRPQQNMMMPQGWQPGLALPPNWAPPKRNVKTMNVGDKSIKVDISAPPPPPPPKIVLSPQTNKPVLVMDDE